MHRIEWAPIVVWVGCCVPYYPAFVKRPAPAYNEALLLYDPDEHNSPPSDSPYVSMFTALSAQRIFHRAIQVTFIRTVKFYVYATRTFHLAKKKNHRYLNVSVENYTVTWRNVTSRYVQRNMERFKIICIASYNISLTRVTFGCAVSFCACRGSFTSV